MRFNQCIIATFTLFSIYIYANPVPSPAGIADLPREVATYCGGYGRLTCISKCNIGGWKQGTCDNTYVNNLINIQPQLTV
jgi:hypothetical protein